MIELRQLRHLQAVATHPTLQAAADALHLTQPALTKSIARFEEALGAPLFDRRGRRLVLTELGERLVARGEALLRQVGAIEEEVALWNGLGTGEVAIGVDPETELGTLPGVLERFVPAHPGVKVTVRSGPTDALLPALLGGELHFLVADAEIVRDDEDLEIRALATDPIVAALRPGHPLARTRRPEPGALAGCPLVGASTAPRFDRWTEARGRDAGTPFGPSLLCDNYEVLVRLVERSDAILFGPRKVLTGYERAGRVRVPKWPVDGPDIEPSLILSRGRPLAPAASALIEAFEAAD